MGLPFRTRAEMIIISEKKILLVTDGRGMYAFPGGGINKGEKPMSAAVREALEEAGAYVKNVRDTGLVYHRPVATIGYKREGKLYGGSHTHFFIGEFASADASYTGGDENFKCEWLDPLNAIRVICNNNWRYDGNIIQPLIRKALT